LQKELITKGIMQCIFTSFSRLRNSVSLWIHNRRTLMLAVSKLAPQLFWRNLAVRLPGRFRAC